MSDFNFAPNVLLFKQTKIPTFILNLNISKHPKIVISFYKMTKIRARLNFIIKTHVFINT